MWFAAQGNASLRTSGESTGVLLNFEKHSIIMIHILQYASSAMQNFIEMDLLRCSMIGNKNNFCQLS